MIRVLLSVKYNIYRTCLKQALEINENICVTGEVNSLNNVENIISKNNYDVVITDINIEDNMLSDFINHMDINSQIGIVFLSSSNDLSEINKLNILKYYGIVSLFSEMDKLLEAVYRVNNKKIYIDDNIKTVFNSDNVEKTALLTHRETEILKFIAQGCFNKEIASKMGITEQTVKNHVSNIFKKIDVCDRTQAALYAIRNNIVIL